MGHFAIDPLWLVDLMSGVAVPASLSLLSCGFHEMFSF
jgi:hypothetical protein